MKIDEVKFADKPRRDLTSVMTCEHCGDKYHPPKGKVGLSKYCTAECARKSIVKGRY